MQSTERGLGNRMLDLNSNNFIPWKQRVDSLLDILDFPGGHHDEPDESSPRHQEWIACSANGAAIMRGLATQRLLDQVDESVGKHHLKLLSELKRLTFSFRFTDLPPELRVRIYDYCLSTNTYVAIAPLRRPDPSQAKRPSQYPPLVSVSRLIRSEALPLFYSRCTFLLDFEASWRLPLRIRVNQEKVVNIGEHTRAWARCLSTKHLRHLRNLQLRFRAKGSGSDPYGYTVIELSFSHEGGLVLGDCGQFRDTSRASLSQYIAKVEQTRQILGQEGESIINAIIGRDEIWKFGALRRAR